MKLVRTRPNDPGFLQAVPLVDIVALVGMMALLGSNFILQPGVELTPPHSPFQLTPINDPEVIALLPGNPPTVSFRNRHLALDEVATALEEIQSEVATIIVLSDRDVSYDALMKVTSPALSRGLRVVLATRPDPTDP